MLKYSLIASIKGFEKNINKIKEKAAAARINLAAVVFLASPFTPPSLSVSVPIRLKKIAIILE
ncbi:hypothetical protein tpqmel_0052 [Candidatus Gastranaerophilus sp. (ex Termes propinquus)]|nr:hypothetical protein tpqmel_0052 [Candidatus Gastranaerophilus sp. (ex Termes propinquus)]